MTYTFQTTGDETEIFDEADDAATPLVLVRRIDGESIDAHHRRVKSIVSVMNEETAGAAERHARVRDLTVLARRALQANAILGVTNVSDLDDPTGIFEEVHEKANDLSIRTQRDLAEAFGWLTPDGSMPDDISEVGAELFDELTHGNASNEQIWKAFVDVTGCELDWTMLTSQAQPAASSSKP